MDSLIQLIEMPEYNEKDGLINGLPVDDLMKAMRNVNSSSKRQRKTTTKTKRKRGGPKRVSCSFMKWRKDNYEDIKKTYFNDYESNVTNGDEDSIREYYKEKGLGDPKENNDGTIKKPKLVALVSIKAGQMWKTIDTAIKEKYDEEFRIEKERYDRELEEYKETQGYEDREREDECEAKEITLPEGWSKAFTHKSISKTIKGQDGKTIKIFKSLEEAIEKAQELGCACYGITQTKRGFSVRTGEIVDNEKAICSWVKLDFEPPIKAKRGRPSTKPTILEDSDNECEEETVEEEEDNTIEVEEICINGKDYYIDRKSKKLYDIETNEVVGIYEEE